MLFYQLIVELVSCKQGLEVYHQRYNQ